MSVWIWDAFHGETPNQLVLFRRTVQAAVAITSATIDVAARGSFRVWVDGVPVAHHDVQGRHPGADAVRVDCAAPLDGGSTLELVVGVHLLGVGTHHQPWAPGGLFVSGTATDADGGTHALDSGPDWETTVPHGWRQTAPQSVWSAGFTEWSDRTVDRPDGGVGPDLPASGWAAAVVQEQDDRPTPYDRRVRETVVDLEAVRAETGRVPLHAWSPLALAATDRAAASVAAGPVRVPDDEPVGPRDAPGSARAARYVRYALERQRVGFLTVDIDAVVPTTVDVLYGETTDDSGWPTATRQGIALVDTVVVPAGRTVHRFWHRRTFRSLAVLDHSGTATVHARFAVVTAERPQVTFRSGSERWNALHAISRATAEVGRQDLYEDCPLREGGHYVADARLQALLDLATTGDPSTARRSLRQFAAEQDPDGMLPALSPSGTRHRIPDFALQWVQYLDDHVRLAHDDELLTALWPAVVRLVGWADSRWDGRRRTFDADVAGWWVFVDWWDFRDDERAAALDAQYAVALRAAIGLAERAGHDDHAASWGRRLGDVLDALRGRVQHPHAAVLLLNGLDPEVARAMMDPAVVDGFEPETGYFQFWTARAELVLGRPDAVAERIERYWGSMLDAGAGTWWERWSPDREVVESTGSSLCHPWSAGPLVLLPMITLGVDPFARTESAARFAPVDLGDGVAAASLHTPWGLVRQRGA